MDEKIGRFHCFYEDFLLKKWRKYWKGTLKFGTFARGAVTLEAFKPDQHQSYNAKSKVTSACGPKIYEFVFDNSGVLSKKCCERLLNVGRECHDSDTNSILTEGEFSKEEREEILARHSEVWILCKRSSHNGGTQPVPAPTVQPLTGCAGKVTSACGPKVYAFVFDKSGVLSEKCCELLLNAGRQCHDGETNSILSEGEFSVEEKKEIMKDTIKSGTFARRMATSACGPKIFAFVLDKSGVLSEKCCELLLNAGRGCHDNDTNSILSDGEFFGEEREKILARHSEVWNLCKRSGHIGGTQPVPAPTVQPLTGCAGKATSACGPKLYAFMTDKSGVLPEKCCELLLNAGRECHDHDTNSILSEGEFSTKEKKEIMERHNQAWNPCKKNGHIDIKNTVI
ncbi:hypothetical protein Cgig2_012652 [Carnegiea gigantea]|uniref:Prolamin-like domain-containing protein n=1 Tax=Carnegiea gigantea TaxID=171969 RepID=A0A9Q1QAX7_9CARY|nr:hypothetical protein Cgig2_012652 [Carnegiea gigantea]